MMNYQPRRVGSGLPGENSSIGRPSKQASYEQESSNAANLMTEVKPKDLHSSPKIVRIQTIVFWKSVLLKRSSEPRFSLFLSRFFILILLHFNSMTGSCTASRPTLHNHRPAEFTKIVITSERRIPAGVTNVSPLASFSRRRRYI
jgi:hypothetical protein